MDVPRTFRVVFDVGRNPEQSIQQLADMKLDGLTGISDKHDMAFNWLGVARDAMLIMKGPEVVKLNKLTRFMYDNPHYFFSKNMWALNRLYQRTNDTAGVLRNILEYLFIEFARAGFMTEYDIRYSAPYQTLSWRKDVKSLTINNIKDLYTWFMKALADEADIDDKKEWSKGFRRMYYEPIKDLNYHTFEKLIFRVFKNHVTPIYSSEGEWVVKDKVLKVPPKSHLYILLQKKYYNSMMKLKKEMPEIYKAKRSMESDFFEKYENLLATIDKHKINKKYVVKFIDYKQWKDIQSKHLAEK